MRILPSDISSEPKQQQEKSKEWKKFEELVMKKKKVNIETLFVAKDFHMLR
jgi:hypothetical protein